MENGAGSFHLSRYSHAILPRHPQAATPGAPAPVGVIGGGWAGCAAAVALAKAGLRVSLFERARIVGGRARRVGFNGLALDNGQHLLIGAYRQTLELIATVHGGNRAGALFRRLPLTLAPFARRRAGISFAAWRAPAPIHLLGGLLTTAGLSWGERWSLLTGYRNVENARFCCPPGQSVAECFAATPSRAMDALWSPLCLAALNTRADRASAQVFANVLRGAFAGRAADSNLLLPVTDLSTLFPDAAVRYIEARGGTAHIGAAVRGISTQGEDVFVDASGNRERFAAAIVAVGPHQLANTLGDGTASTKPWQKVIEEVRGFTYESITTIYLAYRTSFALPHPMVRLDDAPGQWLFSRTPSMSPARADPGHTLLAVVISGNGPHDALDQPALASLVDAQLRRLAPQLPALSWSKVITERRATYACIPALRRPVAGRIADGVYLAGDYTDAEYPATLEAATRSGITAANALLADLETRQRTA